MTNEQMYFLAAFVGGFGSALFLFCAVCVYVYVREAKRQTYLNKSTKRQDRGLN